MTEMRRWAEPVDTTWHTDAECYGLPTNLWFMFDPVGLDEEKEDAWDRAAKAIANCCARCPVMLRCRAEADEHLYEGVWGGQFRERRGVIDTDTGMVWRDDMALVLEDTTPPWRTTFTTETRRKGWPTYVLLTRDELLAGGHDLTTTTTAA